MTPMQHALSATLERYPVATATLALLDAVAEELAHESIEQPLFSPVVTALLLLSRRLHLALVCLSSTDEQTPPQQTTLHN